MLNFEGKSKHPYKVGVKKCVVKRNKITSHYKFLDFFVKNKNMKFRSSLIRTLEGFILLKGIMEIQPVLMFNDYCRELFYLGGKQAKNIK